MRRCNMVDLYKICPYKTYFKDIYGKCRYLNNPLGCPFLSQFNNVMETDRAITSDNINLFINMSIQPTLDKKYDDTCGFLSQYAQIIYTQHKRKQTPISLKEILIDIGEESLIELFPDEHIQCMASGLSIIDTIHKAITRENKTYHSVTCALKICKFVYKLLPKNK